MSVDRRSFMTRFRFRVGRIVGLAFLILASRMLLAEESSSDEKKAADVVARFFEEARKQKGLPKLGRISDHRLRRNACERAEKDDKSTAEAAGFFGEKVGTISWLGYFTEDPNQIPPELSKFVTTPQWDTPHRFGVGVCLIRTGGKQRYWVDIATYMSAFKSLLNVPTWD